MNRKYLIRTVSILLAITAVISIILGIISVLTSNKEYLDISDVRLVQLESIEEGAPIAVIDTSLGEIRAVLYPQYAPKAVENFVSLANEGFYDGKYIYFVRNGVQFVAGAEEPFGSGSDADEGFSPEIHNNLWPLRGAFISMNASATVSKDGTTSSGNRFLVCDTIEMTDSVRKSLLGVNDETFLADAFIENGGVPAFCRIATVFAQTYSGFEVIDAITSVELEGNKPKEDVIINSVTISTYSSDSED